MKFSHSWRSVGTEPKRTHVQIVGVNTKGDIRRDRGQVYVVETFDIPGSRRITDVTVIEQWKQRLDRGSDRTLEGHGCVLEQSESLVAEGGGRSSVDPERIGVELALQPGEDGRLSVRRRHLEGGKGDEEKRRLGVMRTGLTSTHGGFYL